MPTTAAAAAGAVANTSGAIAAAITTPWTQKYNIIVRLTRNSSASNFVSIRAPTADAITTAEETNTQLPNPNAIGSANAALAADAINNAEMTHAIGSAAKVTGAAMRRGVARCKAKAITAGAVVDKNSGTGQNGAPNAGAKGVITRQTAVHTLTENRAKNGASASDVTVRSADNVGYTCAASEANGGEKDGGIAATSPSVDRDAFGIAIEG